MIEALANAFRIPDLRKKILFTLGIIAVYRVGAHIPVPGVDPAAIKEVVQSGAALGLLNLFAGGALENFAIFALGIMPYITASIIMQLLQAVIPTLEQWAKEGEAGQRKITQVTRYLTLGIGFMESLGLLSIFQADVSQGGIGVRFDWLTRIVIVISLLAGTAFIMWLGELITQRGIGNGMSLLIFANIVARFPVTIVNAMQLNEWYLTLFLLVVFVFVVAAVVFMERGQRRIPVQYAKRVIGRKVYGGTGTYIPLKVNGANVIPIIFASSVLIFPATIARFFPNVKWLAAFGDALSQGWLHIALYVVFIVFFTYFYTALVFNPIELADNLRKNGGFIPGVRPGKQTAQYIENVLNRITLPGALFLAAIAVGPQLVFQFQSTASPLLRAFGGTSILIMVGVALETMTQLESQLKMRHYDGFFK
ncbi:MAG: preprotein translocase subunit SecY [Anaerosomatales bacterium]|nr:preprotein translocase subunit SecY [Coriobacteriia bacterium]MDI6692428.1 preprotein translocase subunit SecY [Anaerosomatales bacterium]MDI6843572.1 preprotein translocase subunit SecY [Anaerosomatales bacterium]GAV30718.1 preprotein translocase secY subunit [Coriobacteriaceae bacterium EMTCatB1]